MPTITLDAPPKPFSCLTCDAAPLNTRAGEGCKSCPAFGHGHYFNTNEGSDSCDVLFLCDTPTAPRKSPFDKEEPRRLAFHEPFEDEGGRLIKSAVKEVQGRTEFLGIRTKYLYAVKCAIDNPNKKVIEACKTPLKSELIKIIEARRAANKVGKLTIVACGTTALSALNISVKSEAEAQGRIFSAEFGEYSFDVVFTRSTKAIAAAVGKYSSLLADVERAFRLATQTEIKIEDRKVVEKDYIYPKTLTEVEDLVRHVYNYTENGVPKEKWSIAADTETNTLYPHWDGLQCTVVSLAWSSGKAAAIPLNHKETPYDWKKAAESVKWLFTSGKPTIWFNGKFDYKVLWKTGIVPYGNIASTSWDVMLAEHALEEDKKGQYNLKYLVKQFLPHLSGYEDKLKELLEKEELPETEENDPEEHDVDSDLVEETKTILAPKIVVEAYEKLYAGGYLKDPSFRITVLQKLLDTKALKTEDLVKSATILYNAKKNGDFKFAVDKKKAREKKIEKQSGGYENIPLSELLFYAAVDTDATRQLAIMQAARMIKEDDKINKSRIMIAAQQKYNRDPKTRGFTVNALCDIDKPLIRMVKEDYVVRQQELSKIEYSGIKIDQKYLKWGEASLESTITSTQAQIYELCGEQFKLNSGKKLSQYLFDSGVGYVHPDPEMAQELAAKYPDEIKYHKGRIMYRAHHYTAKGAEQTSEVVLKSLVTKYKCPLANLLLSYKKADKAKNAFFHNIGRLSNMFGDGMIHPGYNLTGTATGRLSSSSGVRGIGFNNQNIIKGLIGAMRDIHGNIVLDPLTNKPVFEGVKCKKLFMTDDDSYCFGNADAKAAEVSIFSAYAKDPALIEALTEGLDAHCFFASEALKPDLVARDELGQVLRGEARRLALANASIDDDHEWSYADFKNRDDLLTKGVGSGDPKIKSTWSDPGLVEYAIKLNSLRDNIKRMVFGMLYGAGVKKISEIAGISHALGKKIQELLFSKFPSIKHFMDHTKWELRTFGFVETFEGRRRRFSIKNAPSSLLSQAERRGINFKVQGQNSDIVLKVLCWFARVLENDLKGRVLLTVHDSIGFQVPKIYASQIPDLLTELGTKRVAKECPWLPVPYRWDVELGANYGELQSAKKYIAGLPIDLPRVDLDGYTESERMDDLREPDEYELPVRRLPVKHG